MFKRDHLRPANLRWGLIAALLGYVGFRKVRKVGPPEKAIAEAKETRRALTSRG